MAEIIDGKQVAEDVVRSVKRLTGELAPHTSPVELQRRLDAIEARPRRWTASVWRRTCTMAWDRT